MTRLNIEINTKDLEFALSENKRLMNKIARRMMAKALSEVNKVSKDKVKGKILKKDSGRLLKSFKYKAGTDFSGTVSNKAFYAGIQENGAVMQVKKTSGYFTFKVNNQWKKVKTITLPARPFLLPSLETFFSSGKAEQVMDALFHKLLNDLYIKKNVAL